MANGIVYTEDGYNSSLNRIFKASPDYLAPTRFKIGTGTTTPDVSDTDLDTPITGWYLAGDYKNYVSGYPTFNTTDQKVTVQAFIASTEANSNSITEYGDFNADGSPVMFSRQVFTSITKTDAIQVFITTRFKRS